jgi:hypothetical protein
MKSNIKREDVLRYVNAKFNTTTQGVPFVIGSQTNQLFKDISYENDENIGDRELEFNEETYQLVKKNHIPVSIIVSEGDYASLATLDQTKRITSSNWSIAVSMLLFMDGQVHDKLLFAVEEVRDKFLSKLDFMRGVELSYSNTSQKPSKKYYKVVTTAGDITPASILTVSGKRYMEYTFAVDLLVVDDLHLANQFEYYIGYTTNQNNEPIYQRVLPITASLGSSNTLVGHQVLRNKALTEAQQKLSQMIHNLVITRGFGLGFVFLLDNSDIIMELFKETLPKRTFTELNRKFYIKVRFLNMFFNIQGEPYWDYDSRLYVEETFVIGEISTSDLSYGDDVIFTVGFAPSWTGVTSNGS